MAGKPCALLKENFEVLILKLSVAVGQNIFKIICALFEVVYTNLGIISGI